MRVIANENVTGTVIRILREQGHDVLSVKESMQGADDRLILECAETNRDWSLLKTRTLENWPTDIDYLHRAESFCSACQVFE